MCLIWAFSRFNTQRRENEKHSCRNSSGARSWRIGLNQGLILSVFDWDWLYNESLNLFELHLIFEMVQWRVTALAYGYACFAACARETTWQALHFSANAHLSVCCWQIQTSPDPPSSSQTSNPDHFTPSSAWAPLHSLPPERSESYKSREEERERERVREALCPHMPSETTLPSRATVTDLTAATRLHRLPLTFKSFLWIGQLSLCS